MHEQVGVASDRRREVRVRAERQSEMPEPLGPIARLHLRPQQLLHALLAAVRISDALDDPVERAGLDDLPEREVDAEGLEVILQSYELLAARRLMDAVHDGRFLGFERA